MKPRKAHFSKTWKRANKTLLKSGSFSFVKSSLIARFFGGVWNLFKKVLAFLARKIILVVIKTIDFFIKRLQIFRYELTYKFHLKVRSVHDTLVVKNVVYKKVYENKLTRPVKNATISAFVCSLIIFLSLQYLLPVFNPFIPRSARAGSNSVTWTTNADFNTNASSTNTATIKNTTNFAGTIAATNGSSSIVGTGTYFLDNISAFNDPKAINIDGISYGVSTVTDNTHMTLATSFQGTTAAGKTFTFDNVIVNNDALSLRKYGAPVIKTSTFTVPSGVTKIYVDIKGGGGGGGATVYSGGACGGSGGTGGTSALKVADGLFYWAFGGYGGEGGCPNKVGAQGAPGPYNHRNVPTLIPETGGANNGGAGGYFSSNSRGGNGGGGGRITGTLDVSVGQVVTIETGAGGAGGTMPGWPAVNGTAGLPGSVQVTYYLPAYVSTGTITGFKIDAGSELKYKWSSLSWSTEALPANTSVTFKYRTSDDGTTWSDPSWSQAGSTQTSGTSGTASLTGLGVTRFLEMQLVLASSNGVNYPTLNDFFVQYDTLETPINENIFVSDTSNTALRNGNGDIADIPIETGTVPAGHARYGTASLYTNQTSIRVKANNLTCGSGATACTVPSTNLRPEVEIKPIIGGVPTAFTGSGVTADIGNTYVDITGLTVGSSYHIKVRAVDSQSRSSAWMSYGNNIESEADITVEQTSPSLQLNGFTEGGESNVDIVAKNGVLYAKSNQIKVKIATSDTGTVKSNLAKVLITNKTDNTGWQDVTDQITDYQTTYLGQGSFSGNVPWTLEGSDGVKTVTVKTVDNAGNVSGESISVTTNLSTTDSTFTTSPAGNTGGTVIVDNKLQLSSTTSGSSTTNTINTYNDYTEYWDEWCGSGTEDLANPMYTGSGYDMDCGSWSSDAHIIFNNGLASGVTNATLRITSNTTALTWVWHDRTALSVSANLSFNTPGTVDITSQVQADVAAGDTYTDLWVNNGYGIYSMEDANLAYRPQLSVTSGTSTTTFDTPETFTSRILYSGASSPDYASFLTSQTNNGQTISYQMRSGNNATTIDASWGSWYTVTPGSAINAALSGAGRGYYQYKATLSTTNAAVTPTISSVTVTGTFTPSGESEIYSANITLDIIAPTSYALSGPLDNTWSGTNKPTLTWKASGDNPGSGLYKYELYMDGVLKKTIDDSTIGATANILSAAAGSDVSYTIQTGEEISEKMHPWYVKVYDKALNTTESTRGASNPYNIGYDSSLPNTVPTTDIVAQASGWFTTSPMITLIATDPGSGDGSGISEVKYRWDNSDLSTGATTYSAAFDMTTTVGDGTHILYFQSKDTAGNYESVKQQTYKLDTVRPTTGYSIVGDTPNGQHDWYVGSAPTITLSHDDAGGVNASGVATTKYQWVNYGSQPGATWQTGTSFTAPLGDKTLYYYSTDVAGNDGAQYEQQHVKFDNVNPISPTGFAAPTDRAYTDSIYLKWFSVSDTSGVQTYEIRRKKHDDTWSGLSVVNIGSVGNVTNYTDTSGLEAGFKYTYQIKTQDNAGNWSDGWSEGNPDQVVGYTIDTVAPVIPSGVVATACDGSEATIVVPDTNPEITTPVCTDTDNKGFEITLAWHQSSDSGVGLSGYKIYRSADGDTSDEDKWILVGILPWTGAEIMKWNDNDVNNADTWDIGVYPSTHEKSGQAAGKLDPSEPLSDSTTYYYRVTAYDAVNNESALFPPIFPDPDKNRALAETPDVTAPGWFDAQGVRTSDAGVTATALGLDGSDLNNESIGHQRIVVSWNTAIDKKHNGDVLAGSVPEYELYRSTTNYQTKEEWLASATKLTLDSPTAVTYEDNGLADTTTYYYRVLTYDGSNNKSGLSDGSSTDHAITYDSNIPSAPSEVRVAAVKGDPNESGSQVGNSVNITFKGSNSKYRQIIKYEVYRYEADINDLDSNQWLDNSRTTKLKFTHLASCGSKCESYSTGATGTDIEITANQDDRDNEYRVLDTGLSDGQTYFYRVRAQDNAYVPNEPDQSYRYGPLSSVSPLDSLAANRYGWDTTPDATKPDITASDLALSVKDTHPSETWLRNVVTWKVADKTKIIRRKPADASCVTVLTVGTTEYCSDFARYEIHREVYDQTDVLIPEMSQTFTFTDINTNILVDSVAVAYKSDKFKYYMVIVDNADTDYKYASGVVINSSGATVYEPNKTSKIYWNGSITPEKAHATIDSVGLSNIGVSSATVTWHTDQSTDSLVEYRPMKKVSGNWQVDDSPSNQFVAVGHRETDVNHSVYIFGMKPETKYEYRVISKNYPFANETVVSTGLPELITKGFTVTYIPKPELISTVSAEIHWTTNMPSNSNMVEYRESNGAETLAFAEAPLSPDKISDDMKNCTLNPTSPLCYHSVTISPLKKLTVYTINIISISLDNYTSTSGMKEFTTANSDSKQFTMAPSASNVAERNITSTSAQIVFQTSEATTATLYYDTDSGAPDYDPKDYRLTATDALKGTTHAILLDGLEPGMKYYYIVVVDNGLLNYTSPEASFTAVLKPKISNLKIAEVKPYSFKLTWDTNIETETLINLGTSTNYSEKRGKPGLSKVHELLVEGLTDNTEYHYQILAKDETGEEVASSDAAVRTPLDTEGPKITGAKVDILPMGESDTTASIIVSWQTNKPATTLVEYDEGIIGGSYKNQSTEDPTLNNSHTVIIKGLRPATSYHFRMISKDKRGNTTESQDYTFVTPTKEKSILQLILKSLEETFAWTRNLGSFFSNIGNRITGKK